MLDGVDFKYWGRSGSLQFMRDRHRTSPEFHSIRWEGAPLYYRPGTSDLTLIYRILLKPEAKREYQIPEGWQPRVIWDVGANIGVTARLFRSRFPQAEIYCFEPVPENVELLKKNTEGLDKIRVLPFALGQTSGQRPLMASDDPTNQGGFSFFEAGSDPSQTQSVAVRSSESMIRELGGKVPDLIKVDTEGSEFEILRHLPRIDEVKWILGELHGEKDFALLAYLAEWFEIRHRKGWDRLSHFEAVNRQESLF